MRFIAGSLVACLAVFSPLDKGGAGGISHAAELPNKVSISYTVSKGNLAIATVTDTLQNNRNQYTITSEAAATGVFALLNKGSRTQLSRGKITAQGLRPDHFEDLREDKGPITARFDWKKKLLTLEKDGKQESQPLRENTHDRLSLLYTFAFHAPRGESIEAPVTDGRHVSQYRYVLAGKETVPTPMGDIETLHFVRQREKEGAGSEIWLATGHHLLPVRILVVNKDGTVLDQMATEIKYH